MVGESIIILEIVVIRLGVVRIKLEDIIIIFGGLFKFTQTSPDCITTFSKSRQHTP